jgi:hypothetical protein
LHPGTEIYVAPRLRTIKSDQGPTQIPYGNGNGKEKEKEVSYKIRMIPGRVASQWARGPTFPEIEVGELENVFYCSEGCLRRVRRKLQNQEGEGAIYVKARRGFAKRSGKEKEEEEEDITIEGWLVAWKEMPDGCGVFAGAARPNWSEWGSIRSANSIV